MFGEKGNFCQLFFHVSNQVSIFSLHLVSVICILRDWLCSFGRVCLSMVLVLFSVSPGFSLVLFFFLS